MIPIEILFRNFNVIGRLNSAAHKNGFRVNSLSAGRTDVKTDFSTFQTGTFLFSGRKRANPPLFKITVSLGHCACIAWSNNNLIISFFFLNEKLFDLKIYL